MFNIAGKQILITGATGYLGQRVALGLAQMGATIHINSRSDHACFELVEKINSSGFHAVMACFDVTDSIAVERYASSIERLDVLINNSYSGKGGTLLTASKQEFLESYNVSVVASSELIKIFTPQLAKSGSSNGSSSVINVGSMYGMVSPDQRIYDSELVTNPPFYGAAKAALIQLTKYAACELAHKNIRVNCISPGAFPSQETQLKASALVSRIVDKVPMGRIGQPNELIGPIAFLASDAASYLTGVNIAVDGGWTSW